MQRIHLACMMMIIASYNTITTASLTAYRAKQQHNYTTHRGALDLNLQKFAKTTSDAQTFQQCRLVPKAPATTTPATRYIPGLTAQPAADQPKVQYKAINRKR